MKKMVLALSLIVELVIILAIVFNAEWARAFFGPRGLDIIIWIVGWAIFFNGSLLFKQK